VRAGKARYIGASSMPAWRFMKMLAASERHGWARFVSMQNHYNLLYREEEREMLPLCRDQGIGVIPWSPLARGRLARPAGNSDTKRSESDRFGRLLYKRTEEADRAIIDKVGEIAAKRDIPRAQVGLAWMLSKPGVTAPIVGATKPEHLKDAVAAASVSLSSDEISALEEHYIPHAVAGFI